MFNRIGLTVVIIVLIGIFVGVSVVSANVAITQDRIRIYPLNGVITKVSKAYNEITIIDGAGNRWIWGESDGWTVGDKVIMVMHSNSTAGNITDDIMISVRYEIEIR